MSKNLLKALFGVGAKNAKEAAVDLLVLVAPETAGEVHIEKVRLELEDVTKKVVVAEDFLENELDETKVEQEKVTNGMSALEILQQDLATATDDAVKAEIEADMSNLMDEVEQAQTELDREIKEDADARLDLDFWKNRQQELADYLKKTKNTTESVRKEIERQELSTQRAQDRAKHGSSSSHVQSSIDDAMQRRLAELKQQEKVSDQMTKFTSDQSITQTSDRVKAAMAKAKGEVSTSNQTVNDRLAAFKQKQSKN